MVRWRSDNKGGVSIWLNGLLEYIEDGLGFWFLNLKAIFLLNEGEMRAREINDLDVFCYL